MPWNMKMYDSCSFSMVLLVVNYAGYISIWTTIEVNCIIVCTVFLLKYGAYFTTIMSFSSCQIAFCSNWLKYQLYIDIMVPCFVLSLERGMLVLQWWTRWVWILALTTCLPWNALMTSEIKEPMWVPNSDRYEGTCIIHASVCLLVCSSVFLSIRPFIFLAGWLLTHIWLPLRVGQRISNNGYSLHSSGF